MSFAAALRAYCKTLNCTNKAVAEQCGLNPSTLSRYLGGERAPEAGSATIAELADGIARLSREPAAQGELDPDEVRATLEAELAGPAMIGLDFGARLDALMRAVGMKNSDIAHASGIDPSYISRIRRGQRCPANVASLALPCSHLAARLSLERNLLAELAGIIDLPDLSKEHPDWPFEDEPKIADVIEEWLTGNKIVKADIASMSELLSWLDETDFSDMLTLGGKTGGTGDDRDGGGPGDKARPQPDPFARFYYGIGGMRTAEISFLEMSADTLARNMSLSSDIPLLQMTPSPAFLEQYQRGIVRLLENGCHVNVVFNVDCPLEDIFRSLRIWLPLYLTGLVKPYYLRGVNNRLFCHVNYVSDTCALASEAMMGHQEDGRYYFTTRPEDMSYYKKKMGFLLEKALPLVDIYRECDPLQKEEYGRVFSALEADSPGRRVGASWLKNIGIMSYPRNLSILTIPCGTSAVHFVTRHPKINYIISQME